MADAAEEEKEKRRKKQHKKMGKLLGRIWQLADNDGEQAAVFQDGNESPGEDSAGGAVVYYLTEIGQRIDQYHYRAGRHGWEDFSRDLGGVYNRHVHGKTKHATLAKKHLQKVQELLGSKDASLAKIAGDYVPPAANNSGSPSKKRKSAGATVGADEASASPSSSPVNNKKLRKANKNSELAEREDRAVAQLAAFIEEKGGEAVQVSGFTARVTRKKGNKFDVIFHNEAGRRFRSMLEVGRYLNLVRDDHHSNNHQNDKRKGFKKATSREQEAQKKKLRKELERLRKAYHRASKNLDDFTTEEEKDASELRMQVDNEEDEYYYYDYEEEVGKGSSAPSSSKTTSTSIKPWSCAAARVPDIKGFPDIPMDCIAEIIMAWDFLCTFERALSLTPIALDDFASALAYRPPEGQIGDDVVTPPVYLAEAHLSLLKLLLADKSSDEWWWSILETDEVDHGQQQEVDLLDDEEMNDVVPSDQQHAPPIKINFTALLSEGEEPVVTTSWIRTLEGVCKDPTAHGNPSSSEVKQAIKAAMRVVANKWVMAYLRKVLDTMKSKSTKFAVRALRWLVEKVQQARPELNDPTIRKDEAFKAKNKVIDEVANQMGSADASAPIIEDQDVSSDVEYDEEEESDDDSDDEDGVKVAKKTESRDEAEIQASPIPPKPLPTFVDMLLPPAKPHYNADFVSPFTWSPLVGATALRVLHRKKKVWNEVDDSLREANGIAPIVVSSRREREQMAASRILMECGANSAAVEKSIEHLCAGGDYLELSSVERLALLRLLIEAAYDSVRVFEVVDSNYKQRVSAMKALEVEQRRSKKEAKEKALANEAAARQQLATEAREKFLDEKRDEIRRLNEKSKEFSDEIIESLTDEDILGFDEDIKADYDALPGPDSFNKTEVQKMVIRMQEEAAFDTDTLRVITMDELNEREARELEEMEGQLQGFGGESALEDPTLDRDTLRSVERLVRDINKAKKLAEKLPELRQSAVEQLKDAMEDGTIKVLRSAITAAKKAKLTGTDDETGGTWAVDLMRDAALELENAKQNKRVQDAQRDLIAKRNRCFIRSEPLGQDRFNNRFWTFDSDENGRIWAETEFLVKDPETEPQVAPGFVDLWKDEDQIVVGEGEIEDDLIGVEDTECADDFRLFSRREYHNKGFSSALAKLHWGCHATEESLRAMIKLLDGRGVKEQNLKASLKDALEETLASDVKHEAANEAAAALDDEQVLENGENDADRETVKSGGDESAFIAAKTKASEMDASEKEILDSITSPIGHPVRVRQSLDDSKDTPTARYENGFVNAWQIRKEEIVISPENDGDSDEEELDPEIKLVDTPMWRVLTDRGHAIWLKGEEVVDSLARFRQWERGQGYFEHDSAFFSYRNSLGRYCGKAAEAAYAASPIFLARLMVKREGELYPKLKIRSFDNNWGGKSGARALWTNSMKDYAYDFQTVRQGLLTLENAFFELTGSFDEYENVDLNVDVKALLENPATRVEIELESIEKNVPGLWNSPASRAVFVEIVSNCKTTGFLALAFDLLCRNTTKYLQVHKVFNTRSESASHERSTRSTRRMNAWQQKQADYQDWY